MKKKGLIITLSAAALLLALIGLYKVCDALNETGNMPCSMPDNTPLEFWITENVKGIDFSSHDEITGWFGAREYLGSDYKKIINSNGTCSKPKYYVSYLVTAYPDYADGGAYITQIEITDPEVDVYGLNVNSTIEEFNSVFEGFGFMLSDGDSSACTIRFAKKDGISFILTHGQNIDSKLIINAEITNREGIQY